ncbi:lymphotoxin-alpha [Cebidichthys violaceus]|uniref:lymphotoxin-alpha n=1 Tax=Cebidichthys violaceus TaxID=271503 RepID=UPI0035CB0C36
MSLKEEQQMNLEADSATHTGMEGQSRSSHKHLLLQVWCGMLTVAMVVMAALLISIKPRSTEEEVSTLKPVNVIPTDPTFNSIVAPSKSIGSSLSYIQLIKTVGNPSWQNSPPRCQSCSLVLRNDSIHCTKSSHYFLYAQVTFTEPRKKSQTKSVILKINPSFGRVVKVLVEGIFPDITEGSVWVANVVRLTEGDSVSLDIEGEFKTQSSSTFWGAYELH